MDGLNRWIDWLIDWWMEWIILNYNQQWMINDGNAMESILVIVWIVACIWYISQKRIVRVTMNEQKSEFREREITGKMNEYTISLVNCRVIYWCCFVGSGLLSEAYRTCTYVYWIDVIVMPRSRQRCDFNAKSIAKLCIVWFLGMCVHRSWDARSSD